MKKYRVDNCWVIPNQFYGWTSALFCGLLLLDYRLTGGENGPLYLCFWVAILYIGITEKVSHRGKVQIGEQALIRSFCGIRIKRIPYSKVKCAVITNYQSYMRYQGRTELEYTVRVNGRRRRKKFIYISLFNTCEIAAMVDREKTVSEIAHSIRRSCEYHGTCSIEMLEELLPHMKEIPIFILKDVYERSQKEFDRLFNALQAKVYIIIKPNQFMQLALKK